MIRSIWSPKICLLERRVNVHKLYDNRFGLYERAVTFEGADYHSNTDPVRGSILAGDIQRVCEKIVDHVAEVSFHKYRISRMALNFKVDGQDRVWFLWCSSLRLRCTENSTIRSNPLSIETGIQVPSFVSMSSMAQITSSHVVQTAKCASCGTVVGSSMTSDVLYKAIVTHFEHVLEYMYSITGDSKSIQWPPDRKIIEAGGNVGFGILNHIESRYGRKETYMISNLSIEVTIPPAIRFLHPTLTDTDFMRYKKDPIFLYQNAPMCENCYLVYADYSMSTLESNLLHRGAPKILRPPRTGLHSTKLTPMTCGGTRTRRTPADAWTPVAERRGPKRKPYVQSGGMKFSSPPKLPGGIDTATMKEISGRVNKDAATYPLDLDPPRNAIQKNDHLETTGLSSEDADMIHHREEQFFAELYSNPNIDRSHPLSHMIESASRMQVGSMSHGNLPTMQFGMTSLSESSSLSTFPGAPEMGKRRGGPGPNPYSLKPKHMRGKAKKKTSPKKKTAGNIQHQTTTTGSQITTKGFTKSAMNHREFLLQTLNEVKQQMTEPDQTLSELVEETTPETELNLSASLDDPAQGTRLASLDLETDSLMDPVDSFDTPLEDSFLDDSKDLALLDAAKKLSN